MPLPSLAIMPSQLPLLNLKLGNPTKPSLDYTSLTKLRLLQLDYGRYSTSLVRWVFVSLVTKGFVGNEARKMDFGPKIGFKI